MTIPFSYPGTEFEALRDARNYYRWIYRHFFPHLHGRVIEVGAGLGNFSEYLLEHPRIEELVLVEPDERLGRELLERYSRDPRVRVAQGHFEDFQPSLSGDCIVLVNVLEHIEDDKGFLNTAHRVLAAGARILIFVPALPQIYGSLDKLYGHHRRYEKRSLRGRLEEAGFKVLHLSYFNFLGAATWFFVCRVLKMKTFRSEQVKFYDRWIVPWMSRLEKFWIPPFGQSLVAVAEKCDLETS